MGIIVQIGQGLLYTALYLVIWLNGPRGQYVRLLAWERAHPSKFRRAVQPVSWAFSIGAAALISTLITMNFRVIFDW